MLILQRSRGETICIDPTQCPVNELGLIEITVIEVRGDKVRLGITAAKGVVIHRKEVWDMIQRYDRLEDLRNVKENVA